MPTNTNSGGQVSFTNAPQAKDDNFLSLQTGLTEDSIGIVYLDVMANDAGGNAKSLWSIDNGENNSGAMSGYITGDLLNQDTAGAEAVSSDTSVRGARIWITADGKVGYDASTLSASFKTQLQSLSNGEDATDSFTYAIRLGNGALSWATATVHLGGTNDGPWIVVGATTATGGMGERTDVTGSTALDTANGIIAFADADLSDTHRLSQSPPTFLWSGGGLTAVQASALSSASTLSLIMTDSTGTAAGSLAWTYKVTDGALDFLSADQTLTVTYMVAVTDNHGAATRQAVTITIAGANDAAVIGAPTARDVTEDVAVNEAGALVVSGTISISDADQGQAAFHTQVATAAGNLGSLSLAANGSYTYAVSNSAAQSLGASDSQVDTFTITSLDGSIKQVTFTIHGANDAPTILSSSLVNGAITERDSFTGSLAKDAANGVIQFSDVDLCDVHTQSASDPTFAWSGGLLAGEKTASVTAASSLDLSLTDNSPSGAGQMAWSYSVADGTLDFLAAGETMTVGYTITVTDSNGGSVPQPVTITITGANDRPTVTSGKVTGALAEASTQVHTSFPNGGDEPSLGSISGSFTFADADLHDTHSVSHGDPSFTWSGGTLGAGETTALMSSELSLVKTDTTGAGSGTVMWTYSVSESALQFLAEGEYLVVEYPVLLDDGHDAVTTQPVTITITGTNDAPVVAADAGDSAGTATPLVETNAGLHASGTLTVTDLDVTDLVRVRVLGSDFRHEGETGGLTDEQLLNFFHVTETPIDTAATTSGRLTWTFDSGSEAFNFLGAGETVTLSYVVRPDDNHQQTGAGDGTVTIKIVGTNDAPVLTSSSGGSVFEQAERPAHFLTGDGPYNVAAGDLDRDGTPDIVTSNYLSGAVSVLIGNGDGTFLNRSDYLVGYYPHAVAMADLNNDNIIDLIVGNQYQDSISVLLGNGDGAFRDEVQFAAGANPWALATSDLNRDGWIDVVVSDESSDSISVLMGNSEGLLAPLKTYAAGPIPFAIAVADVNGDGNPDAVTSNVNDWTVSVMLGMGDGSFAAPSATYDVGRTPVSIAIGDLNGDGHLDLAVANRDRYYNDSASNSVSLLFGDGDGTFQPQVALATGLAPTFVALGDIDRDGIVDIVTANSGSDSISILYGNEGGTFSDHQDYFMGARPEGVAIADFNRDGLLDFATANSDGDDISVLLVSRSTVTGVIAFVDDDAGDSHAAFVESTASNQTRLGVFSIGPVSEAGASGAGTIAWRYELSQAAAQYLAEGETTAETYSITLRDSHGATATEDVTISTLR